ncbi:MAG: helix-turn-helix domain-containing protein [Acidimicrobiales bacterium]
MRLAQAYRFELAPNDDTAGALASHIGADRFAFNWGLALVKARLGARARVIEQCVVEGRSDREAAAVANTVVVPWTLASLRKEWNRSKATVAPWWAENSKEAYSSGLDRLARALQAFSDSRSGRRRGPPAGFPRFRRRGGRASVAFTTGAIAVVDEHHVRLPRIGVIRTKEATTSLARRLDAGSARIRRATVSTRGGRW